MSRRSGRVLAFSVVGAGACLGPAAGPALAQSITTLFASNGSVSSGGALYFDITVAGQPIAISAFDVNAIPAGSPVAFEVYTTPGTYAGNETNPGVWTLRAIGSGTSAGLDLPTPITLASGFTLPAGSQSGVAVVLLGVFQARTNGNGSNQHYSNADLSLDLGTSSNQAFVGLVFSPRVWNGVIHYAALCYPDCNADGSLTVADFGCFQARFVLGDLYADCNEDAQLTVADFGCFQTKFVAGCP